MDPPIRCMSNGRRSRKITREYFLWILPVTFMLTNAVLCSQPSFNLTYQKKKKIRTVWCLETKRRVFSGKGNNQRCKILLIFRLIFRLFRLIPCLFSSLSVLIPLVTSFSLVPLNITYPLMTSKAYLNPDCPSVPHMYIWSVSLFGYQIGISHLLYPKLFFQMSLLNTSRMFHLPSSLSQQ